MVLDVNLPSYLEEILIVAANLKHLCRLNWPAIAQKIIASDLQRLRRIALVDESHLLPSSGRKFCLDVDRVTFGRGAFRDLGTGIELCFQGHSAM